MIKYADLGMDKCLNDIVIAGSHDAGITAGSGNVQTQDLDIFEQANAGVRLFDIRITGAVVKKGSGGDVMALKAYHGQGPSSKTKGFDIRTGQAEKVKTKSMWAGEYGMTLTNILTDAAKFVSVNPGEFLILKFDKCHNWEMIAEACTAVLGANIYTGGGNLNNKKLRELQGKVIVVFSKDGIEAVGKKYGPAQGILGILNMYSKEAPLPVYKTDFNGLQYFGKGGTSLTNLTGDKIAENKKKQSKLMAKGSEGEPEVIGMMYWTATGLFESIRERNNRMWNATNVKALQQMWSSGLEESIFMRLASSVDPASYAHGAVLKAFMPNIVMIDFADGAKCRTIYDLNAVVAASLTSIVRKLEEMEKATKASTAAWQANMDKNRQRGR